MDRTDIEILKAVFEAFSRRDVETVLAHAAEDVVFSPMTADYAGRSEAYTGTTESAITSATRAPCGTRSR